MKLSDEKNSNSADLVQKWKDQMQPLLGEWELDVEHLDSGWFQIVLGKPRVLVSAILTEDLSGRVCSEEFDIDETGEWDGEGLGDIDILYDGDAPLEYLLQWFQDGGEYEVTLEE